MDEIVRVQIPKWPAYSASRDGVIWTQRTKNGKSVGEWRSLSPRPGKYRRVSLCANGKLTDFYIHHLILFTFVGPRPEGMEAIHKNDVQADNRADNLKWGTHIENCMLRRENGKDKRRILTDDAVRWIRLNRGKIIYRIMADTLKVSRGAVVAAALGHTWKHLPTPPRVGL